MRNRKRKYLPNSGGKFALINLSAQESDWEGFVKRLFDRNTPY